MTTIPFIVVLAATVSTAAPAGLPLRSGSYVQADTPCRDAPFAVMKSFDGKGFGDPHAAQCRSRVLARHGDRYRISTTCRANGDGSPAPATTEIATFLIPSPASFVYLGPNSHGPGTRFRLCPPDTGGQ